jgi:glycosyltransferase involved in cell wall biosynthesis
VKISIVVPIYNTVDYLEECVNSLTGQTYQNIEIILVDDGSTDGSGELCDRLKAKDDRIIVIHKENGGNTSARKAGTAVASGEYILYVDSDDWIDSTTCEAVLKKALDNNADVVRFALQREYQNGRRAVAKDNLDEGLYTSGNREHLYENLIYNSKREVGTTNTQDTQLTKTSIFKENYYLVDDEIQYAEDFACVVLSILMAERVLITHDVFYHYRMREGSIVHTSNPHYYTHINMLYLFLRKLCAANPYSEILLPQVDRYMDVLVLRGINARFIQPREPLIPDYFFHSDIIPRNARVVVYGAGIVGKSYVRQFRCQNMYAIAGWVDRYPPKELVDGFEVQPVTELLQMTYDYLVVAIKDKNIADQIREDLVQKLRIAEDAIVWEKPVHVFDYYCQK